MAIPDGGFRLHWDEQVEGVNSPYAAHVYEDFPNFEAALAAAAIQYAKGNAITRLENWMGEDAAPLDQVIFVAEARTKRALERHDHMQDRAAMETSDLYGMF